MSGFRFMGQQEDPEFDTIEARGDVRIYDATVSQSITYVACGCGKHYFPAEFAKLEQKGTQESDWPGESLALANCARCGSTIAMPILEAK